MHASTYEYLEGMVLTAAQTFITSGGDFGKPTDAQMECMARIRAEAKAYNDVLNSEYRKAPTRRSSFARIALMPCGRTSLSHVCRMAHRAPDVICHRVIPWPARLPVLMVHGSPAAQDRRTDAGAQGC